MVSAMPGAGARSDPTSDRSSSTRFSEIRRFSSIDSTNRYLLDEARAGAAEGMVALADHQVGGRGRRGRSWVAPPGSSLLVSLLFRPRLAASRLGLLASICGLAAADACLAVAGVRPGLKWPNDLVVADRKLAGVLAEADLEGGAARAVVVGVGLNVRWPAGTPGEAAPGAPERLSTSAPGEAAPGGLAASAVTLEEAAGRRVDREALLAGLLDGVGRRYAALGGPGGELAAASEHRRRCVTVGRPVRVELADETFTGVASDVDAEGRLLVDVGACLRTVAVADVVHLRPL